VIESPPSSRGDEAQSPPLIRGDKRGVVPIIGMGGIMTPEDAVEFLLAGATAVAVGTANFVNPLAAIEIIEGLERYMQQQGVRDVHELIGAAG